MLIRHVALSIPMPAFLEITLTRFEVPATLDCAADLEFLPGRLQSWLLLLAHLLAYHSPLSMPVEEWTRHALIQQLSHGPRTARSCRTTRWIACPPRRLSATTP